ncbi:MAG: hypothetical protein FD165_2039 [Gammaproteobacteria bacterium]|nr:MAG: hypothetical protein FD165_2039 [Gammaproteobacteria bacterium]TND05031.1 MAG: hypothetical protein FD120_1309 [Gammaproteobacteria bacterium]
MQTALAEPYKSTPAGQEADAILRSCVHCGFCNATCPTYQLLGDELDGPRGRIYQIKQLVEGAPATERIRLHLDRCLTCRNCETTCPSGVQYGNLLDIGRDIVEAQVPRPWRERTFRRLLRFVLPYPRRLRPVLWFAGMFRALLPATLREQLPQRRKPVPWPVSAQQRKVIMLDGCVQSVSEPGINAAAARVFDRLGYAAQRATGANCCGAVSFHLSAADEARTFMRANIDAWWPLIAQGAEAIIVTSSACSLMVKDYGRLLKDDAAYAGKAARVSELCCDIAEFIARADLSRLNAVQPQQIAFHAPCTLQHGSKLPGIVEQILGSLGFTLTPVKDAHLCCGAAGTYSILQPALSKQLLVNKVAALENGAPALIATANIGCLLHLQGGSRRPVKHWIELLDNAHH